MARYNISKPMKSNRRQTIFLAIGAAIVIIIAIIAFLELTNRTYFFHKRPTLDQVATQSTPTSSKGESGSSSSSTSSGQTNNPPTSSNNSSKTGGSAPTGQPPKQPFGNFVSSHTINMEVNESSVCNTSVGATCVISFTKDGVTKSLESKATNSDGAAFWQWTPKSIGLTTGTWQITATASANGQNASATDQQKLEVQP